MKNLKLTDSGYIVNESLKDAQAFCIDSDSGSVYFGNQEQLLHLQADTKQVVCKLLNLDLCSEKCQLIAMEYVLDTQFLCFTFDTGDIATYRLHDELAELVGSVSSGITHSIWSPDQELLLVLTGDNTFILMTKEFDPLVEKSLHPEEFGESKPMTVGWGSKETQFHGSEGKAAAKVKTIEPKTAMPWDDQKSRSIWRGDGELFATSVIDPNYGCRKIRIWSREGVLQYTSEVTDGLEQALNWRPSGNLIVSSQQLPNKHQVIFYEKNGLRHGEFTLPYQPNTFMVKEVLWNLDSSVLCVWGHQLDKSDQVSVTLWTTRNYHWYLKQSLDFHNEVNSRIKQISWDPHYANKLHVLCSNGQYLCYNWMWSLCRSQRKSADDNGVVAVIDNGKALITHFGKMIVPPPMCSYEINCASAINTCIFRPSSTDFCLVLANNEIAFFSATPPKKTLVYPTGYSLILRAAGGNGFQSVVNTHHYSGTYSIKWTEDVTLPDFPLSICNWTWKDNDTLICAITKDSPSTLLLSVNIGGIDQEESLSLTGRYVGEIDGTIVGMCSDECGFVSAVMLTNGRIWKHKSDNKLSPWEHNDKAVVLPVSCPQFSLATIQMNVVVLALSDRCCFYVNDLLLFSNCTSYHCHGEFLLVTTSDDKVKCYAMRDVWTALYNRNNATISELSSQQCERGCRIVTTIYGDTKLILQMPRGNLETIHPRPLVLSAISHCLDKLHYNEALSIAKEHRINLNVLYDHDPVKFRDSVSKFVDQIHAPSDLNLFLVSLTNENVMQTLYPFYENSCKNSEDFIAKRDIVCDLVRSALSETKVVFDRFFETVIATYTQKTVPEIADALLLIKEKRDMKNEDRNSEIVAEKALNFLLLLVDVNELYKVALGTYDFELAIMVAEKSNMDPKEYLPFLNELQGMNVDYRKYKIDMHVGQPKKALQNISKCGDHFDECLTLIKDHRLYTSSLNLFPKGTHNYKTVWREYADYLMKKMYYRDAGMAYSMCEDHMKAYKAYIESGDSQLAISSLHNVTDLSHGQYSTLYGILAAKLSLQLRWPEAAHIFEYYLKNEEKAILTYIAGQCWDSAFNLINKSNCREMVSENLKPAILECHSDLTTWFSDKDSDFDRHAARLKFLRLQAPKNFGLPNGDVEDDLFSETSSVTGASTQSSQASKQLSGSLITRKSSRSRKKNALKKFRLKEGSPNEDLALMAELSAIIAEVDKQKDNFYSFVRMLVLLDELDKAITIQANMKKFIAKIELELPNIWITSKPASDMTFGPDFTTKDIVQLVQAQSKTNNSSDSEVPPPTWRKNMDIFLQLTSD